MSKGKFITWVLAAMCASMAVTQAAAIGDTDSDLSQSAQAIDARALTPSVILATLEKVADWQLANPVEHAKEDWHWVEGAGDAGFMALAGISGNAKYRDAMFAAGERAGWQLGDRIYDADDHTTGQMYAELFQQLRDPVLIAPMRVRFDYILANPREGGLTWMTPGVKDRWSWADSLFMAPPAWARLTAVTGDQRYLDFALRCWRINSETLYDQEEHLFFRDSRFLTRKEANGRKVFWGRGNGWVIGGLVRTLQYMPAHHPERAPLVQQFREMSAALLKAQQADGMWRASLLDPASFPISESSASGLILFGLAWGVNQGLLSRDLFGPAVKRGWLALNQNVTGEGKLAKVQPIGGIQRILIPPRPKYTASGHSCSPAWKCIAWAWARGTLYAC